MNQTNQMDTFPMTGIEIVLSHLNWPHLPVVWGSWPFVWKSSNYMLQCFLKERMQRWRKNECGPPIDNNTAWLWWFGMSQKCYHHTFCGWLGDLRIYFEFCILSLRTTHFCGMGNVRLNTFEGNYVIPFFGDSQWSLVMQNVNGCLLLAVPWLLWQL